LGDNRAQSPFKRWVALTKEHRHKKLASDHFCPSVYLTAHSYGGFLMRHIVSFCALALLALGVLTACNSAEQSTRSSSPRQAQAPAPPPSDGVRRVTINELQDLLASNGAIVIDVRNQAAYDAAHIRGAKLIPEGEVVNHLDELPRNKLVVTYCS
jgi:hypothetical protein